MKLIQHYLQNEIELSESSFTTYAFSVDANLGASTVFDRFSLQFENETLGVTDLEAVGFSLYPNPTESGRFTLLTSGMDTAEAWVRIFNLLGQEVYASQHPLHQGKLEVNANDLQAGVYLVKLEYEGQSFTSKLIVK